MFARTFLAAILLLSGLAFASAPARAEATPQETAQQQELRAAFEAASAVATNGPAEIPLVQQASLKLPAEHIFIPLPEAARIMRALGNSVGPQFIGLVFPADSNQNWFVTIDFTKSGYVRDDEAKSWNADELLRQLKEGTEAANEDRIARGFPAVEVIGWAQPPSYDAGAHKLVWAATLKDRAAQADPNGNPNYDDITVNYNTYALGREGFFELNLITAYNALMANQPYAHALLAGLEYLPGKRYGDFVEGADEVAAFGIGALIAGGLAKKLGLFGLIGAFLLKAWKLVALGVMFLVWAVAKLFRRDTPQS